MTIFSSMIFALQCFDIINADGKIVSTSSCSIMYGHPELAFVSHGHTGTYCGKFPQKPPRWMHDNFEEGSMSGHWENVEGAAVGQGCGTQQRGNTLLFSAPGYRSVATRELDTRAIR